jgi:hypothetical protein
MKMTITLNNLIYAGSFAVDSGQAIVGDPCYLDGWKKWEDGTPFEHEEHKGEYGYLGACGVTLAEGFGQLGSADAVAFSTGHGDGLYPVYVKLGDDGSIGMVIIDFEGSLDDQDNE